MVRVKYNFGPVIMLFAFAKLAHFLLVKCQIVWTSRDEFIRDLEQSLLILQIDGSQVTIKIYPVDVWRTFVILKKGMNHIKVSNDFLLSAES